MGILSINITGISAEKKGSAPRVEVKINPTVKEVGISKLEGIENKPIDVLKINYELECKYEPEVGNIMTRGILLWVDPNKNAKDLVKMWEKEKKLPDEVMIEVLNGILRRVVPKLVYLADELQLPPVLPIPRFVSRGKNAKDSDATPSKEEKVEKKKKK